MTQTYKMKHNAQGTIYSLLTVESDGRMTMTFHGTDREISHEANVTEDGRIATAGSLFPGLESGRWQALAAQMRNEKLEMRNENEEMRNEVAKSETTTDDTDFTDNEPLTMNPEPSTINQPRPRRQRKPRKPRVEHQEPLTVNPEPLTVNRQPSSTLKAVGMVAAATVALFVIYETGLLIPLGLIGLATGGILK